MVTHGVSTAPTASTSPSSRVPGRVRAGVTIHQEYRRAPTHFRSASSVGADTVTRVSTRAEPTALLTDKYELTMLSAALRDGTAQRQTTFEVFARRLPEGRRYGVVAGAGRFLEA